MLKARLELAVQLAREAGVMLREEFHRPGGPRGGGHEAAIDREVELLVSERLATATPEFNFRGEETENRIENPGQPVWAVDPNDGTKNFLQGHRGASFSIALIAGGKPVLGVVYAPCSPDDNGDLIAWAEGHPLTRNGDHLTPPELPATPAPDCVIMQSSGAQRKWTINVKLSDPCRYIALPSIAYRLALVGAGDGVMAVTLNSPASYDMAAGHAILRAAGGQLVNADGEIVTYTVDGRIANPGRFYFGGSLELCRHYCSKPWREVWGSWENPGHLAWQPANPARLVPGDHISDPDVLNRAQGCLLGQCAGDALGSLVEFNEAAQIRQAYPHGVQELADGGTWDTIAGQPTDDTEMALLLARSLVSEQRFDLSSIARHYSWWHKSGPFNTGATINNALNEAGNAPGIDTAERMKLAAERRLDSQANGALMRVSPLGIFGWQHNPSELAQLAAEEAALTHVNPVCRAASAAYSLAIATAIRTGNSEAAYDSAHGWLTSSGEKKLLGVLEKSRNKPPADFSFHAGWVLIAFQNAFYHLLNTDTLDEAVRATAAAGGDTDTNAAITGALMGAVQGREAVPAQWRRMVLSCRPTEGLANVRQPRLSALWPVDALELAELLLLAGKRAYTET